MSRPRTPLAKAIATGEAQKRPGRFGSRREPKVVPLGRPSPRLTDAEKKHWAAFKRELPWLMESDQMPRRDRVHVAHDGRERPRREGDHAAPIVPQQHGRDADRANQDRRAGRG